MMLKPLKISVFVDNEDSETSALSNKPLPMTSHDVEEIDFYTIDSVSDYTDEQDENRKYGGLISSGTYYITTYTPKKLRRMIDDHLTYGLVLFTKT